MEKEKRLSFQIHKTSRLIRRFLDNSKKKECIEKTTDCHGHILGYIYDNREKDIFQKDIEREFNIRPSTATNMLKLMEKNGMIVRVSVENDARLKKIVLTKKALDIHNFIELDLDSLENRLSKNVTEQEREVFFKVLEKINNNIQEADIND